MADVGAQLADLRVRVTSPNGACSAELVGRSQIRLAFSGSFYYRTDERELEAQAEALCRLLWAARAREVDAIVTRAGGRTVTAEQARSPLDEEYYRRLDRLVASGRSPDGRIEVTASAGMRQWSVRIEDGTLQAVSEEEFIASAAHAADALIRDQLDQVMQLKAEVYDPESQR